MEANDNNATVADVATVRAEIVNDKGEETLALVRALISEGAAVQVTIHYAEAQAPAERYEAIEIGGSGWRQNLQLPVSMTPEQRSEYIRERVMDAAKSYAEAAAVANKKGA